MIKIAFLHERKSYLPEIDAYADYLNQHEQFEAVIVESESEIDDTIDIIWRVMGIHRKRNNRAAIIHEYNTITVGKNAKLKDMIKRLVNCKPDGRIFQNERVREVFNFKDNIPFIYRDMGIHRSYYQVDAEKIYDFVYVGTMDPSRKLDMMLKHFADNPDMSILMIGTPDPVLEQQYGDLPNIHFIGRIANDELPVVAAQAKYGLNYIPDIFPFNEQTSTKLIEYCALGLNIVTTDYKWVNEFEAANDARFMKVTEDLTNLTQDNLSTFEFNTPSLEDKEWSHIFEEAELIDFLLDVYKRHLEKVKYG